ncbi:MAG: ATP-grasp domain-containing protein [Clostridia bacterium]|nr:ATP-grasp domain-containing protein [Clostridia bacterium]
MRGLMLYTFSDAEKNRWFIRQMQQEGARRGHLLSLYLVDQTWGERDFSACDFCINRSRMARISREAEALGKISINNAKTIRIANDKWLTYQLLKKLELPCMDTFLPGEEPAYPFVAKSRAGHGGNEVFLVKNDEEYAAVQEKLADTPYILQAFCDEPGVDVRAYVMGDQVMAAVKRTSKTDFRSNFSLGGQAGLFALTQEQQRAVRKLQKVLNSDYIGIDFIRHREQWVVNEIEDAAGARMLYSLTDVDFIGRYWDQIEKRLEERE